MLSARITEAARDAVSDLSRDKVESAGGVLVRLVNAFALGTYS